MVEILQLGRSPGLKAVGNAEHGEEAIDQMPTQGLIVDIVLHRQACLAPPHDKISPLRATGTQQLRERSGHIGREIGHDRIITPELADCLPQQGTEERLFS